MTDITETDRFEVVVEKQGIEARDVIALYVSVGWGDIDDYSAETVQEALLNTSCVIHAVDRPGNVIGLARVFGDGAIHTSLAEIVVHPVWQRRGVGRAMLSKVCELYANTAIFLETFKGQEEFFRRCGFATKGQMIVMSRRPQNL